MHIKSMDNVKSFYKALIQYLSHNNLTMVVFSLFIITSLCLNEEIGDKLFQTRNVNQTFQLIFHILIQGDDITTRRYVVDLFVLLLKSHKIQQSLLVFEDLSSGIQEILKLLTRNSESEDVAKAFELLLAFCKVSSFRCTVCQTLMSSASLQNGDSVKQLQQAGTTEPFFAILHWASQSYTTHELVPLLALDFLKEMYEEMSHSGLTSQLSPRIDLLLPTLSEQLQPPTETDDRAIKHQCIKTVRILQVIDAGVDVVLHMLELMCKLQRNVSGLEERLLFTLQDPRMIRFLCYAITSDEKDKVQLALHLVSIGANLANFSITVLSNAADQRKCRNGGIGDVDSNVQSLIDKIQGGLEHGLMEFLRIPDVKELLHGFFSRLYMETVYSGVPGHGVRHSNKQSTTTSRQRTDAHHWDDDVSVQGRSTSSTAQPPGATHSVATPYHLRELERRITLSETKQGMPQAGGSLRPTRHGYDSDTGCFPYRLGIALNEQSSPKNIAPALDSV
uniref:Protein CIP2A homolog n=1 Tax=Saccoglossus kowalevskii TaxID=10224 RepID=A0ABM0MS07_SACKO|nr:PREDICTED: protein CIP2A homolog [Saccoglossus kowalevskii]